MGKALLVSLVLVVVGCGDDGSEPAADARTPIADARSNDAPVDAAPPVPCAGCELCAAQNDDNQYVNSEAIEGDRWVALKFRFSLTRTVRHVQVFTGEVNGTASTMRIYDDAAGPDSMIGFGNFNIGQIVGWQGAAMDAPVSVPANSDHWIAWFAVDGAQATRAPMGMVVNFRESTDDGANWSAESSTTLKYRIYCDP